jgi:hypothetical protein
MVFPGEIKMLRIVEASVKRIETKNSQFYLKLAVFQVWLAPLRLPT